MTARRARFLVSVFLAAAALHATPARPASTGWVGLASPNFLLAGDVRPNDLREVAVRLEQFRETLRRLLPDARLNGGIPTVVVAFATRKGYEPFQPLQAGKRLPVGGLFVGSQDVNYLTMSLEGQARGYPVIFHEYTHLVLRENLSYAPFWFHEGLSEYYSTFELADEGRRAYVGRAVDAHVIRLRRTGALIPLAELLDADRSSPVFSAEATRPLFYAQSWVLTHYLLIGNASRAGQLQAFLRLLSSHVPRAQAFRQAFAAEPREIERELQAYVRRYTFRAERVTFEERIAVDADRMQPFGLTEAAVQARLGDLLLHMNRLGEAEARLRSAVALDDGLAAAHVSLGMLRMRQDRFDAGMAEFARAIALDPESHAAHYMYGAELLRHWDVLSAAQRNAGRAALERAAQLRPDSVDTLAALGEAYLFSGTRLDEAQRLLERTVALAPWDDRHKLTLAQVYLRQRDVVKAREVLGPLVARGETEQVRESARTLLASTAVMAERILAQHTASAEPLNEPAAERAPARLILALRPLAAGEQRVEGVLEQVGCTAGGLTFRLRAGDRTLRFAARRFVDVEFITYRNEPMGDIRCGVRPPGGRAILTFRPSPTGRRPPATDGMVVAVEFVPPDYTLRQ